MILSARGPEKLHKSLRFVVFTTADYVTAMQCELLVGLSEFLAIQKRQKHACQENRNEKQPTWFHKYHCVYLMQLIEVNQFMVILTRDNNIKAAL